MASVDVFWCQITERVRVWLRRSSDDSRPCPAQAGKSTWLQWCAADAEIVHDEPMARWGVDPSTGGFGQYEHALTPPSDPRWPLACEHCGRVFDEQDRRYVNVSRLYVRTDTGDLFDLRDTPVGALWDATWIREWGQGADGLALQCQTPGGPWHVDGRASNCTLPGDNVHRCWVRHGDPRDPKGKRSGQPLHVDKAGVTCGAGAGSIQHGSYHGFLHGGELTDVAEDVAAIARAAALRTAPAPALEIAPPAPIRALEPRDVAPPAPIPAPIARNVALRLRLPPRR